MGKALQLGAVGHQRVESVRQRDGGADGDVVRIALDPAQLGDTSDVEHLREIAVLLGDPQSHIGASGHDLRFGVLTAQRQQLGQVVWGHVDRIWIEIGTSPAWNGLYMLQFCEQLSFVDALDREPVHGHRGVNDGPVAGAAAQVAGQGGRRVVAGDGRAGYLGLIEPEQAHGKARRAEAALGAVALHQRLLHRVQTCCAVRSRRFGGAGSDQRIAGQVLGRPERQPVDGMGQADAGVDGAVLDAALHRLAEHHGAGAAVAFATALLGPGAAEVLAQDFQQGAGGWYIDQRHDLAAADEPDGWVCHVFVPCARG